MSHNAIDWTKRYILLKIKYYECIYLKEFDSVAEVREALADYFDYYNTDRLHQSLDYNTPADVYFGRVKIDNIFDNYESFGGLSLFLGAIYFSFQIYCDFSGYSDIAIGAARIMGYDLMENFPKLRKTLITSTYDSCIAFMFSINKRPENFPIYFDLYKKRGILSWMASGSNLNLWTAHTKGSYANKNLNQNKNQLQNEIFSAIQKVFSKWENSIEVYFHSLHIWKYAKVKKISSGLQIDPDFPVALAGDFMEGSNIESAFISGEKAANLIFNRLNQVS